MTLFKTGLGGFTKASFDDTAQDTYRRVLAHPDHLDVAIGDIALINIADATEVGSARRGLRELVAVAVAVSFDVRVRAAKSDLVLKPIQSKLQALKTNDTAFKTALREQVAVLPSFDSSSFDNFDIAAVTTDSVVSDAQCDLTAASFEQAQCEIALDNAGLLRLAWRLKDAKTALFRLTLLRDSWLSIGLNLDSRTPGSMKNAYAIIAQKNAATNQWEVAEHNMAGYQISDVVRQADLRQHVVAASVTQYGVRTVLMFERQLRTPDPLDAPFHMQGGASNRNDTVLFAYGAEGEGNLGYHNARGHAVVSWDGSSVVDRSDSEGEGGQLALIRAHSVLMVLAWAVFAPAGFCFARLAPRHGKYWFIGHKWCMVSAVGATIVGLGMILGRSSGDGRPNGVRSTHTAVGWAVVTMACLQPLNAIARPHAPGAGERKSRMRRAWEVVHRTTGSLALVLAALNVALGLEHPYMQSVPSLRSLREALVGLVSAAGGLLVVALLLHACFSCRRPRAKVAATAYDSDTANAKQSNSIGTSATVATKKVSL